MKEAGSHKKRGTETEEHIKLKEYATTLLKKMGCKDITWEMTFQSEKTKGMGYWEKLRRRRLRLDVVGLLDGQLIAVECGGCSSLQNGLIKQLLNTGRLAKLYVLPYGEDEPYEWSDKLDICLSCGHIINKNIIRK